MENDNNPTPWPPEPQAGVNETVKKPVNKVAGWISLAMALLGGTILFIPLVLPKPPVPLLPLMVIELLWWGAAIVFGIFGRRSRAGKIGLIIIMAFFILVVIVLVWLVAQHAARVSAPAVPSVP